MIRFRVKAPLLTAAIIAFLAFPVAAQAPSAAPPGDPGGRSASFLPPPSFDAPDNSAAVAPSHAPISITPNFTSSIPVPSPTTVPDTTPAMPVINPPSLATESPALSGMPLPPAMGSPTSLGPPPGVPAVTAAPVLAPAVTTGALQALPVTPPPSILTPVPPAPQTALPVDLGSPVQQTKLNDINPQSVGLIGLKEGGLGVGMWKDTPRELVENILPTLDLPSYSLVMNGLAERLLLTTADVPAGKPVGGKSFTSLRIDALLQLGDAKDAWQLVSVSPAVDIDDDSLKNVSMALLAGDASADVCKKLPDLAKTRAKTDWQELLLVCQLQEKDTKAAQLTLDLMHSQGDKDDIFFYLAEHNVMAGAKELPRQLTPMKPLMLALLEISGQPVRSEVYAHPEASLVSPLLEVKTHDDNMRLSLAEHTAERGLITTAELESIYASIVFPPEAIQGAVNSNESLYPRLHALLYQSSLQEKDVGKRVALAVKFIENSTGAQQNGVQGHVIGDILGAVAPSDTYDAVAADVAHIYLLIGNAQATGAWLAQARHAAIGMPNVASGLQRIWPLIALSGLEADADYSANLPKWLTGALAESDPHADSRLQREKIGSVLLLLDAAGYSIPEDDWAKVLTAPTSERHVVPPAMLLDRLRASSVANHRGETVLLSLLLSGGTVEDPSLLSTLAIVRALRLVGLGPDSAALAREAATLILTPPPGRS